jgi:uncharacterized protein YeaO (DUF488 family)
MALRIVRLGSPRAAREGLRIGTVRRPPRGVKKADFARAYRREMQKPDASHLLELLAKLSHETSLSVGCYCEDESRCHRSLLRELLVENGARIE